MSTTSELHAKYEPHPSAEISTKNINQTNVNDHDSQNVTKDIDYEPHPSSSQTPSAAHAQTITHITNLYSGSASETDMSVYATKAIYDDPFSYCDTRYKIAGQWYGIPKLFARSRTLKTEVVRDEPPEIVFKLQQEYTLKGAHLLTKTVNCLVSLALDEEGKVRYHKDMWNEKDYSHEGLGKAFKTLNGDQLTRVTRPPEGL